MRLSECQFKIMVDEVLSTPPSYNMLCRIAEESLRKLVTAWCNSDPDLRRGQYADDVMQEIHLQLMQKTVPYFLLREGIEGEYNDDPQGFECWMTTVAKNKKRDFAEIIREKKKKDDELKDKLPVITVDTEDDRDERREYVRQVLSEAFFFVLSADMGVHKKLTWLMVSLIMLREKVNKIQATRMVVDMFTDKPLSLMYDVVSDSLNRISWLDLTYEQHLKMVKALNKKADNGLACGECLYADFFMGKKPDDTDERITEIGRKSVSDWMNRINTALCISFKGNPPPKKKGALRQMPASEMNADARTTKEMAGAVMTACAGASFETDKKRSGEK